MRVTNIVMFSMNESCYILTKSNASNIEIAFSAILRRSTRPLGAVRYESLRMFQDTIKLSNTVLLGFRFLNSAQSSFGYATKQLDNRQCFV
ncbi:hypothetical protein CU098_005241 [Rhizopus stolonifer]|uniref:Uncharacterized protein n=1 Tax=Rhizopus stolonifer TaxID=4846 RepID=A0A367IMY1_RHIST|nr:hypothetical protein CU098_005241 [Rhizopus stolonifer]